MAVEPLKSFRVVDIPVEEAEDWLNSMEELYVNTANVWYQVEGKQRVTLMFVHKRLLTSSIARPRPVGLN